MITVVDHEGVAVVTLERGKANALDLELCVELTETIEELDGPIVLTGAGRMFSAGVDLDRLGDGGPAYVDAFLIQLTAAFRAVFDHPAPVVAAVNGHAIAGGCILAAAADVRLMSAGTIGLAEMAVGVPLPVPAMEIMRHVLGSRLQAWVLDARAATPDEAAEVGLIDLVCSPDDLLDRAVATAQRLGKIPASTFALTKRQLHAPVARAIEAGSALDAEATALWSSDEVLGAVAAFRQARLTSK